MAPIRDAIAWTLERHDPFPAIVIDRHWNVVDSNRAAVTMFAFLGVDAGVNMIDLFIDEGGIRTSIENWPEVGYFLLTRLRTQSYAVGGDEILDAAIATLAADPSIAQFGSAEDISLADQRIELFFPADESTKQLLLVAAELA